MKFLLFALFKFQEHTGRVFRLQFDEFQIVSSSHDDTILIWDFLNSTPDSTSPKGNQASTSQLMARTPSRKYILLKYLLATFITVALS